MAVRKEHFGTMSDGREFFLYTITNKQGLSASFTDLGAVWTNMMVPDRSGQMADVLLGYEDASGYLNNRPHMGSVLGRIANRTGGARYVLNGKEYHLGKNDGANNLHSGPEYFDQRLWNVTAVEDSSVTFRLESPDGDQGYPGNAVIFVKYTLTDENVVEIEYQAVCDHDTPMNLTNHAYFNLGGHGSGPVYGHLVQIDADRFTPTDRLSIPTGECMPVHGTPMDFTVVKKIGDDIHADFEQLIKSKGYDHNYCLNHAPGEYALAAWVYEEASGRALEVFTDLPGVQFYTGNWLDGKEGKDGILYHDHDAFCFETQFFPDAVNKPQFASPVIKAGERFVSKTGYHFFIK
ncbi:MAG: galactose mutarotase [Lachnospiraceae bacterium]|nr:galactose mutarotase [Lachnospiraceae bacterium]